MLKKICDSTSLKEKYLESVQDIFLKSTSTGKLNKNEFILLYSILRPENEEKIRHIAEYVFNAFDSNKNGFIKIKF